MRTIDRARAQARHSNLPRIGSLLMLGVLVLLLSSYAREAKNWKWLTDEDKKAEQLAEADPLTPATPANPPKKTDDKPAAEPTPEAIPDEEKPLEGATDLDPEQQQAVKEEFQALDDGGLKIRVEEMNAYWRLFAWTKNQTTEQLLKRAKRVSMHDLQQRPDELRGRVVRVELTLKRLLPCETPENIAGVKTVYEGWGWSDATHQWPYTILISDLPEKMPTGDNIHEKVTFVGYFYKKQGYHDANAKPNQRPLTAPLLIGRVIWRPAPPAAAPKQDPWWMWAIMGGIGVVVVVACIWPFVRPRTPPKAKSGDRRPTYNELVNEHHSDDGQPTSELEDRSGPLSYLSGHAGTAESN